MSEVYTLVLRSEDKDTAPNKNSSLFDIDFYVDWTSFLPKKYNKFLLRSSFITQGSQNDNSRQQLTNVLVDCSIVENGFSYDTSNKTRTSLLLSAPLYMPTDLNAGSKIYYYKCGVNESAPIMIQYPPETYNYVNVLLYSDGASSLYSDVIQNYVLTLTFEPIAFENLLKKG